MKQYVDPVTGDSLSLGEHLSWLAQGFIRKWWVLITLQVVTFAWLTFGSADARIWWNFCWSDLAVIIEGIVGIGMFSTTRRDQIVLREVRKVVRHVEALVEHHGVQVPPE